jgi:hypothetical protein
MKAKLIKTIDGYHLRSLIKDIPRSINVYHKISKNEGEFGFGEHSGKLSKQNCDEIFGGFDVNKLAEESWGDKISSPYHAYIEGFNKAMELNKDKVFTEEDMRQAIEMAREENGLSDNTMSYDYSEDELIQSLQQPTEIEVMIEMELNLNGKNAIERSMYIPKLDENGCLILTKKEIK